MSAFQASQVEINSSVATELVSGLRGRYEITVKFPNTGEIAYLGDSGVTASNGYPLELGNGESGELTMNVLLDSTDALYAITSSGTLFIYVMVSPR